MSITAADVHQGWLTAGKGPATGGDGPLATARDDAAFAAALASLTKRQRQIVRLRARGLTIAEIGDRYYLSENTIKNHLHAAFRALGLSGLRHQARLGRALYLLGRHDARRRDGETGYQLSAISRDGQDGRGDACVARAIGTRRQTDKSSVVREPIADS